MSTWRNEMEAALVDFVTVSHLSGDPIQLSDLEVEYLSAPHRAPSRFPNGKMAIYAYWWNDLWLKIGQAGPKSAARYTSHHYNPNSSNSNLAKSLANDVRMKDIVGFDAQNPGNWIKESTCRVNILIPAQRRKELLSLLETYLHARLRPRYEG